MEQQKPQIPTLKDSQKPQVKIKGLQAGLSLIDRLKQFKKKDLAFITAGLGVLFMAPLAEHFMMSPENQGSAFNPGWDFKNAGTLGANASPYESGINGLAPGGVTGGGDIITPLNVRDPSALVMGPGATQQAPATNVAPPPPPPSKSESDGWKDAIANAASRGASEATKRAALPVPKPSLTNAGLRGLGAVSGGGGGSFSGGPISSAGLTSNRAAGADGGINRISAAPGFRGVAGPRGGQNASAGSMEALKKASSGAIDTMNRSGQGSSALEQAAQMGMGGGSSAGGRGGFGDGGNDKGPSGSQDKNSSNVGESLAFMRMKQEQEKAIDLKWKQIEMQTMMWPELKKKMLEELAMAPVKGISAGITDMFKNWGANKGGSKKVIYCSEGAPGPHNAVDFCVTGGGALGNKKPDGACERSTQPVGSNCKEATISGEGSDKKAKAQDGTGATAPLGDLPEGTLTLEEICTKLQGGTAQGPEITAMREAAKRTIQSRNALAGGHSANACGSEDLVANKDQIDGAKSLHDMHSKAKQLLAAEAPFGTGDAKKKSFTKLGADVVAATNDAAVGAWSVWQKDTKDVGTKLKQGPGYDEKAAPASIDAAVKKIGTSVEGQDPLAGAAKSMEAMGTIADQNGQAGVLPSAKKMLDEAGKLLTTLNKPESMPDKDFGNGAMTTNVEAMKQGGEETQKIYTSLKANVDAVRKNIEKAGEVQKSLNQYLQKAKEYRPAFDVIVANVHIYRNTKPANGQANILPASPLTNNDAWTDAYLHFGKRKAGDTGVGFDKPAALPATANGKDPKDTAAGSQLSTAETEFNSASGRLNAGKDYLIKQAEAASRKITTLETDTNGLNLQYK